MPESGYIAEHLKCNRVRLIPIMSRVGLLKKALEIKQRICVKVEGKSMEPFLEEGQRAVVNSISAQELKVGDIILFYVPRYKCFFLHRIIDIKKEGKTLIFSTKGDNAKVDPDTVKPNQIIGVITKVIKSPVRYNKKPILKMNKKVKVIPNVFVKCYKNGLMLYNARSGEFYYINKSGKRILYMCNKKPIKEAIETISSLCREDKSKIEKHVSSFLKRLLKHSFIKLDECDDLLQKKG